jgi:hypothetical protein
MIRNVEETFDEIAFSLSPVPRAPTTGHSIPTVAGVGSRCCHDQMLQFAPVEEDAAALDAQVHHDAISHAPLHMCIAMRAKPYRHLASFRYLPTTTREVPIRRTSRCNTQVAPYGCCERGANRSRHLRSARSSNRRHRFACRGILRRCIPRCGVVKGRTVRMMNLRFK